MKTEIQHADIKTLANFAESLNRQQLPYHEYPFIKDGELRNYFTNKQCALLDKETSFCLVALQDNKPVGLIGIEKDEFDSSQFELDCYRITDLVIHSDSFIESSEIAKKFLLKAESLLLKSISRCHLSFSLNNNLQNSDHIFNSLTQEGFYYIHTLLTFGSNSFQGEPCREYPDTGLVIREASSNDVECIADIAGKSFTFSRFQLDPFLDNHRASILLQTSARNSVLQGFADIVFVAEVKGEISGYYSAKKKSIKEFKKVLGEVIISAVNPACRGMGLFSKMDQHIQNWFASNTHFAEMGTYLANYPVHKTWINKRHPLIRGQHQFSKILENSTVVSWCNRSLHEASQTPPAKPVA